MFSKGQIIRGRWEAFDRLSGAALTLELNGDDVVIKYWEGEEAGKTIIIEGGKNHFDRQGRIDSGIAFNKVVSTIIAAVALTLSNKPILDH